MFKKVVALSFFALTLYIPYVSANSYYEEKMGSIRPSASASKNDDKPEIPLTGDYGSYSGMSNSEVILIPNLEGTDSQSIDIRRKQSPKEAYLDAHELRLKARELTSQLLESWVPANIKGMVAYITTFTPQSDLRAETEFGQYLRNAFMYEFNQRGFAVRDFSARNLIINKDGYAYGISDGAYKTSVLNSKAALVTGTFYRDEEYLFINIRLIRGSDGMVLRSAQTILPVTPLVSRMTKQKPKPLPPILPSTTINVVQGK